MADINKVLEKIKQFRDDRDWMQFHDPKSMAVSVVLEAGELLEHFQWKSRAEVEEYIKNNKDEIAEEMADIVIYLLEFADNIGIDLIEAADKKIDKNTRKYPVKKAKGSAKKYNQL